MPGSRARRSSALTWAPTPDAAVYASNERGNTVAVISTRTNAVIDTILVGRRPRGLKLSPDGRRVYVALGDDDAVGVIDVARREMVDTIPTGIDPEQVVVSPDGRTLYVANEKRNMATAVAID